MLHTLVVDDDGCSDAWEGPLPLLPLGYSLDLWGRTVVVTRAWTALSKGTGIDSDRNMARQFIHVKTDPNPS